MADIRYADRFSFAGGRFTFSVRYPDLKALSRMSEAEIEWPVRRSTNNLLYRVKSDAPVRTGALSRGLRIAPGKEKTATYGKVVNDIVFDAAMNDTFAKYSKAGIRYYYPASQEYGFRISRGRRKPGLYYMRDTAAAYYFEHEEHVVEGVMEILEDL